MVHPTGRLSVADPAVKTNVVVGASVSAITTSEGVKVPQLDTGVMVRLEPATGGAAESVSASEALVEKYIVAGTPVAESVSSGITVTAEVEGD
jgi:hypothetical protein